MKNVSYEHIGPTTWMLRHRILLISALPLYRNKHWPLVSQNVQAAVNEYYYF